MNSYGLLIFGIAFIVIEFAIPGFGFFGITGLTLIIASIVLAASNVYYAIASIVISLIVFSAILVIFVKKMPEKSKKNKLFLDTMLKKQDGFISSKEKTSLIGQTMTVNTFLRPSGKVKKDGKVYDAMSNGEFIEKGKQVEVIGNEGYILIVKEKEGEE